MTARLGSEYRYFGKLVLVPFRYFSIDTYRNIDIFDNTNLQCLTSSKDSEKLEKSMCVRDNAEDLCWMPVVFEPSDDTASIIGMILSLTLLNGLRNTSRNHCR